MEQIPSNCIYYCAFLSRLLIHRCFVSQTLHWGWEKPSFSSTPSSAPHWIQIRSYPARLRAVPIFPLEFVELRKDIANAGARKPSLVFPCLGFRAPVFAMSFRGSTNSRGKIGTARSLIFSRIERKLDLQVASLN